MVQRYEIILNLPKKLVEINKKSHGEETELFLPLTTRISKKSNNCYFRNPYSLIG